jgi:hypothetical protein
MLLQGEEMDEYVIYVEQEKYSSYLFRLEVNEEHIGVGLNKGMNFKEEREKSHETHSLNRRD